jgi:PAS domain S-box-containing protein
MEDRGKSRDKLIDELRELRETHDALRKERDFAESILETAQVIVLVLDPEGRVMRFNRYMEELSGYALEEVKGCEWFTTFLPENERGRIRELYGHSLEGRQACGNINAIVTKDGRLRDIEWYDHTLRDGQGGVVGVLAIGQDVTEHRRNEERILRQQYLLEKAQELGQIGTWELDLLQDRLLWTDENCRIFGVPPGTVADYGLFLQKVHPEDQEYVHQEWSAALEGKPYDIEHRLDIDGTIRWVREKADLEFDEDGKAIRAIGFTQDITERKEAQIALRESQEELAEIFNMSLDLICVADINEEEFLKVNPAFTRVLGYDEAELVGHPFADFVHRDDVEPTGKVVDDQLRQGKELVGFENRYRCKDGTWRWLEWTSHPLPERGIAFAVAHDTTRRRQREERLRQAEKMEAIGQLAGGVAHDFNNQLGGIMNYADLLLSKTEDEELRPCIEEIVRLCARGGELTSQLLAFARKGKYKVERVDIHRTIAEVAALIARTVDRRIAVRQILEASPPTTTGDASQLRNALLNLCLNACDAMPEGGDLVLATDTVGLAAEDCRKSTFDIVPGEYLRVRVTDTGTGMDESTRARVFEPFFTTKEQGKGTGMGLPAVFGTVVNHRGAIEMESKIGGGTTISVYLPLAREGSPEAEEPGHTPAPAQTASASVRVLVVDDERAVRECTAKMLRHKGYEVTTCEDGAEAVEYYRTAWPDVDVVILDMNMPVMNGHDAFLAMREINAGVKAILATGYSLDENAQRILNEGALSYIQKPFRLGELISQVQDALSGQKVAQG